MKLRLSVLAVGLFLYLVALVVSTEAQLNFSTGWGKRSQLPQQQQQQQQLVDQDDPETQAPRHPFRLQPDLDFFLRYYHRLKQIQAQRLANSSI